MPDGISVANRDHIAMMADLMVLAFQSDSTRMITFMLAHDGSNRAFLEIGVPEAHHQLSPHRGNEEWLAKIAKIDRFYTAQFARFLKRMKSVREGEGSLLDHSMAVYGSCISDGTEGVLGVLREIVHPTGMLQNSTRIGQVFFRFPDLAQNQGREHT